MLKRASKIIPLLLIATHFALAGNNISGNRATIISPLSDEDVVEIEASRYWPESLTITLKKADDTIFTSLKKLPKLQSLIIDRDCTITSLEPLVNLPDLRSLRITSLPAAKENAINAGPVSNCKGLRELTFYNTPVTGLNALAACTKLEEVSLYMSQADSIEFLRSTPSVTKLDLYGRLQKFPSYEPVATLKQLRDLSIYMNPQANDELLACLEKLTKLEEIQMSSLDNITTLAFLRNNPELERISASSCDSLSDISALANMPFLQELGISRAQVSDIHSLSGKPYLQKLDLSDTQVTDLSPIADCIYMKRLELDKIKAEDLSPLSKMQLLEYMDLSGAHIDPNTLPRLRKLEGIRLNGTAMTDLAPLVKQPRLKFAKLDDTPISDISPLLRIQTLNSVELPKAIPAEDIEAFQTKRPNVQVKLY